MRKFHKKSISHFKKNQVLTDQELAKLFLSLYPHYKDAKHKKPNQAQAIYDESVSRN